MTTVSDGIDWPAWHEETTGEPYTIGPKVRPNISASIQAVETPEQERKHNVTLVDRAERKTGKRPAFVPNVPMDMAHVMLRRCEAEATYLAYVLSRMPPQELGKYLTAVGYLAETLEQSAAQIRTSIRRAV